MIDDDGKQLELTDQYGIALVPTTFDMSISEEFEKFLDVIGYGRIDTDDNFFSSIPYILK